MLESPRRSEGEDRTAPKMPPATGEEDDAGWDSEAVLCSCWETGDRPNENSPLEGVFVEEVDGPNKLGLLF